MFNHALQSYPQVQQIQQFDVREPAMIKGGVITSVLDSIDTNIFKATHATERSTDGDGYASDGSSGSGGSRNSSIRDYEIDESEPDWTDSGRFAIYTIPSGSCCGCHFFCC